MGNGILDRFGGRPYTPRGLVNMGPPNAASRFDAAEMARLKMLRLEEEARLRAASVRDKPGRGFAGAQSDPANTQPLIPQSNIGPDRGLLAAQEVVKQRAAQEIVKQRAAQEAYDKSNHPGEYPGQPSKPPAANQGDKFDQWLKMRFIQDLIAGTAGGDPPQPYTVKVGSVREWKPLNMYGRGLA